MSNRLPVVFILSSLSLFIQAQHPSIGGYNVYYGHLHNHTTYSDGTGTPAQAYNYAKHVGKLDFFGLSDHSQSITPDEWADTKAQADAYNSDGAFTAFYGFEWSGGMGHITVVNSDDYTDYIKTGTIAALIDWLADKNAVAFFNHPGKDDNNGEHSYNSSITPSLKIVGMELWNKSDGFSTYYCNTGYHAGDNKGDFDEALTNGWMLGAEGSGDDHYATWGTAQDFRMAILAENLTRADLLDAMKARRFYSTLESDIRLSFKMDGQEMGSAIREGSYAIQIQAEDGGNEDFTKVILYDKNHNRIRTWMPNKSSFTIHDNITTSAGDYYYVKVLQADSSGSSGQAISSPVFVTSLKTNGSQSFTIWPGKCKTIQSNISGGTPPYTYQWSPAYQLSSATDATPDVCPAVKTTYYVTVTDAIGCRVTNEVTININPLPINAGIIEGPTTVCQGENEVSYSLPDIVSATSYIWTLPDGSVGESETNSITVDYLQAAISGEITVRGHNAYGDGVASFLPVTVNPGYAFTDRQSICEGDLYNWQGKECSTSGIYTAGYKTIYGCDSTYTLYLTVNPVYSFTENQGICEGDTFRWQGADYTETGTYIASYRSINGCDSIYTLNLTVNPVYSFTMKYDICQGDTIHWQGSDFSESGTSFASYKTIYGCDSTYALYLTVNPVCSFFENHTICNGDSYNWQDTVLTKAGKYTVRYTTVHGCDSIYTLDLAVDFVNTDITTSENTIHVDLTADKYQWFNCRNSFICMSGEVNQSYKATENGQYAVKITRGLCSDTSACVELVGVLNNSPEAAERITVYPNPFHNELIVETSGDIRQPCFEIVNPLGQVILKGRLSEKTIIQTDDFIPGIYMIRFENNRTSEIRRIVKN